MRFFGRELSSEQSLLLWIFVGIVVGVLLGGFASGLVETLHLAVIGQLFLRALKMVVIPIVVTSIICGVCQLGDARELGKMGALTVGYYLATTAISVTIGLILVNIIQPGAGASRADDLPEKYMNRQSSVEEMILSFIPENIFASAANMDILPLIFFALFLGLVITTMGEKGKLLSDFFDALNEAIMKMVHVIILASPVGIGCLIAGKLAEVNGFGPFFEELVKIAWYAATVILGLLTHAIVVLAGLLVVLARRNPWQYFKGAAKALATAFGTASSSATLPLTVSCAEEQNQVSPRAAGFVLPLGATVNMDGTALYEAVAALFVAQAYGIELSFAQQVIVAITATLAGIGAAGVPEAGLVMMVLVFQSVGLPLEGISLLLIIDWFLDRCRTTVNVWGDSVGAAVVDALDPPPPRVE